METRAFIAGEWVTPEGKEEFVVRNPSTNQEIAKVVDCGPKEASKAIEAAKAAFATWRKTSPMEKSKYLQRVEAALLVKKEELGKLLTLENGKPLNEGMGEVGFAASFFGWFAGEARRHYGDFVPSSVSSKELLHIRQPLGVAAMITPWNFPIGMLARKVAAALAAGCTCVLKPAEDTPLIALAFAKLIEDILPKGTVNIIPCSRGNAVGIGRVFCESPDVAVLSFTGSTAVGKLLYANSAGTVKRLALELGGNAPFVVFESADMEAALEGLMASKFRNTGQTCVTANRIFIAESIYETFLEKFKAKMESGLTVGDGTKPGVNQGPLINQAQYNRLSALLEEGLKEGCKLELGGTLPHPLGQTFFPPTLLSQGRADMKICQEEQFGPVAVLIPFKSEEEVIALANDTRRGLAGYFFSRDLSQIWRVAKAMEVGMVGVNEAMVSTCEAGFSGVKESGMGIEGSMYGMDEYSSLKYVCFGNIQQ